MASCSRGGSSGPRTEVRQVDPRWGTSPSQRVYSENDVIPKGGGTYKVGAPYTIEGEVAGTVGVLGPTRMDYQQALAAVSTVSAQLGNLLSH